MQHIVIQSPDIDVAVLASCYTRKIQTRLLLCTGTNTCGLSGATSTLMPCRRHGHTAVPGLHSLPNCCDSTSAFVGLGKKTGLAFISGQAVVLPDKP